MKSRFATFRRGSKYASSRHYVTHAVPMVSEGRYRDMADSALYADCGQRATSQTSRWARTNEQVVASKPRGDTARRKSENILRNATGHAGQTTSEIGNSLAGPGRRRLGLESHRPVRAWARDFENTTRWAGRGLGRPPGSTPPPGVGPTRKNRWI